MEKPTAFDAFAGTYDTDFTHTQLAQILRQRVWRQLAKHFNSGAHILELACGTGEDALWLGQQGIQVTATDSSSEMLEITRQKVGNAGISHLITTHQLSLQQITNDELRVTNTESSISNPQSPIPNFDGVLSNFGGLNTINNWANLAASLAKIVKPGGKLVLVPMAPFCPWEIVWYGLHGQFNLAKRRWGEMPASAKIGNVNIPIYYPSMHQIKRDFALWFTPLHSESLGLWLPTSTQAHFVTRFPRLFKLLAKWEERTARFSGSWGDHYIVVLSRL